MNETKFRIYLTEKEMDQLLNLWKDSNHSEERQIYLAKNLLQIKSGLQKPSYTPNPREKKEKFIPEIALENLGPNLENPPIKSVEINEGDFWRSFSLITNESAVQDSGKPENPFNL